MPTNQPTLHISACQQHVPHSTWSHATSHVIATRPQRSAEEELEPCYEKAFRLIYTTGSFAVYSLGLMSEVILFCFESICFQSLSYNTDKGTQTITLGWRVMPPHWASSAQPDLSVYFLGRHDLFIQTTVRDHPFLASSTGMYYSLVATVDWKILK